MSDVDPLHDDDATDTVVPPMPAAADAARRSKSPTTTAAATHADPSPPPPRAKSPAAQPRAERPLPMDTVPPASGGAAARRTPVADGGNSRSTTPVSKPVAQSASVSNGKSSAAPTAPVASDRTEAPAAAVDASAHGDNSLGAVVKRGLDTGFIAVPEWISLHPLLACYTAEAIGTFLIVLTTALIQVNNPVPAGNASLNISPLPIGLVFMCCTFCFHYISGAHFNPAVTIACFLYKRKNITKALGYILVQCATAVGATLIAMFIQGNQNLVVPDVSGSNTYVTGFFSELIFTFGLCTAVLNVGGLTNEKMKVYDGFAQGTVVVAGISAVGGVSGGVFNPAVATGLQSAVCITGTNCAPMEHFWLYWLAPAVGAIAASLIMRNLRNYNMPQEGEVASPA